MVPLADLFDIILTGTAEHSGTSDLRAGQVAAGSC